MEKRDLTAEQLLRLRAQMEQGGRDDKAREQALLRFAGENLSSAQQKKMHSVLRDRDALQRLLQSDEAQRLIKKLRQE